MGDGMLTALVVAKIMRESGKKLSELASEMRKLPQVLVNASVTADEKKRVSEEGAQRIIMEYAKKLKDVSGRVLVRPSGTENLVRVTMWGDSQEKIDLLARELAEELKEELKNGRN